MSQNHDNRIVMTLDAGGTNFVFSALQGGEEIVENVSLPSNADNLDKCLNNLIEGFKKIKAKLPAEPVAISFAFPGPADYPSGIIGELENLPAFKGGVALGPMLKDIFNIPVFINNDGDLFAYGEAMAGLLPEINARLKEKNIDKQYHNLFGVTLGTGFGGGVIVNNQLCIGDNSAGGEVWLTRNFRDTRVFAEEGVSIRAVKRVYLENCKTPGNDDISPKDIYEIAKGEKPGDQQAAILAFEDMAVVAAESMANAVTLLDGVIVVGGGIGGAQDLFLPKMVEWLNGKHIEKYNGDKIPRLVAKVYNMEDPESVDKFLNFETKDISVPFSNKKVTYVPEKKLAIGMSRLGTSRAISLGAYHYALNNL